MSTTKKMKKARVVYYLARNGQLEHPHFMEVTHLHNQPLRLKDIMDRLTALRGKGMPSMYSWSCKRSYKNGFVWNDLLENDALHPSADGAEYVLKGSEIVESCSGGNRLSTMTNCLESNRHSKRLLATYHEQNEVVDYSNRAEEQDYERQEEYEDEKTSYTSSTTSRCSRGVSTDELEEPEPQVSGTLKKQPSHEQPPNPSTLPSPTLVTDHKLAGPEKSTNSSSRFTDKEIIDHQDVPRFILGRNSVLLQLISCGNVSRTILKGACHTGYRHNNDLHKAVACKSAAKAVSREDEAATMITYMSENPRFGNLQSEEKEYFSGSIVESMRTDRVGATTAEPSLKRSNSYNAGRGMGSGSEAGIEEKALVEEMGNKSTAKSKCIPRILISSSSSSSKTTKKDMQL